MLSKLEQETIINFNAGESNASIEVPVNSALYRKLIKLGQKPIQRRVYEGKAAFAEFVVPKRWIKVTPPRKLTEKQREQSRLNALKNLGKGIGIPKLDNSSDHVIIT